MPLSIAHLNAEQRKTWNYSFKQYSFYISLRKDGSIEIDDSNFRAMQKIIEAAESGCYYHPCYGKLPMPQEKKI